MRPHEPAPGNPLVLLGTLFLPLQYRMHEACPTLLQSVDDPQESYSFGPWRTLDDVQEMRSQDETRTKIAKLLDLCEEARPGTFRVVATA